MSDRRPGVRGRPFDAQASSSSQHGDDSSSQPTVQEDNLAFLSLAFRQSSLSSENSYPIELMDARRVRTILDTGGPTRKTPAKITSFHIEKLSDKVIGSIKLLRPLDVFWSERWDEHIGVCMEPLSLLVDEIPGVDQFGLPSIKKELRDDVSTYLPKLKEVYQGIKTILATFESSKLEEHKASCSRLINVAVGINIAILDEMDVPRSIRLEKDGKACLGRKLYDFLKPNSIPSSDVFDDSHEDIEPQLNLHQFWQSTSKHEAREIAIKLEKVLHIWKDKMRVEPAKSQRYMRFILNARWLLQNIRVEIGRIHPTSFPTPFSDEKIKHNEDVGRATPKQWRKWCSKLLTLCSRWILQI